MEKVLFWSLGNFSLQYGEWSPDKFGSEAEQQHPIWVCYTSMVHAKAVTLSDFHRTIIIAKRRHDIVKKEGARSTRGSTTSVLSPFHFPQFRRKSTSPWLPNDLVYTAYKITYKITSFKGRRGVQRKVFS